MSHYTIPVFIPELACPNRCVFCNQQKISGALCQPTTQEVVEAIENRLATIPGGNDIEIGFFGGNFTGIEPEIQESFLDIAQQYVDNGRVQGIRLSTRPDYIDLATLRLLKKYKVNTIELGAQSLDEEVLGLAGRGHTAEDVKKASRLILGNGFHLGLQMMIGLPGDTLEKSISTARQIVELGAGCTRIYPTLVIKDTELETLYRNGHYKPMTLEDAVSWTKEIVKIFEKGGVKILRIGLHPSEEMLTGDTLLSGPFHVAFGEIVRSSVWGDLLGKELSTRRKARDAESSIPGSVSRKHNRTESLLVEVPIGQLNAAIGHKAVNKKMLLGHYQNVLFKENPELKERDFHFTIVK
jgi:histone acetyltransferase (RNA polymerase elongator complex component)